MRYATNSASRATLPDGASFLASLGEDVSLNELFAAYMPRLARTARRLVRNAADSEDVVQECLLSAFKNLHQFEGRAKFSTWLHSIVRNKAKMHLRRLATNRCCSIEEKTSENGELLLETVPLASRDAEELCAESERSRILRRVLMDLPERQRSAVWVCDIEGIEGKEAAARLGMSLSGLKTRLHRARKLIARKVQENYATAPAVAPHSAEATRARLRARRSAARRLASSKSREAQRQAVVQLAAPAATGVRHDFKRRKPEFCFVDAGRSAGACSLSGAA